MKSALAFLACTAVVLAASVPRDTAKSAATFTAGAWRTDESDIIFLGPRINASGGKFYVNRDTSTYCPTGVSGLDCTHFTGTDTTFGIGADSTTMSLDVTVPGGQQVYLAPDGSLSYTQAHSAYIPPGSIVTGFSHDESTEPSTPFYLNSELSTWYLCPVTYGEPTTRTYQIFASNQDLIGCYDTRIRTYARDPDDHVWQYA
ncbi:hypothetical protein F5Y03DRAFT_375970 [Xylaria venustula]|nr:hypothetical protein F5Y03DRAFT_375970 [Xylaria venustula]